MTNQICDIQLLDNGQCYPLRFIEKQTVSGTLFENKTESESPKDAVTNQFLKKIKKTLKNFLRKKVKNHIELIKFGDQCM